MKCPLCGKEYSYESQVIKCINDCARDLRRRGFFKAKEAPHSEDIIVRESSSEIENFFASFEREE